MKRARLLTVSPGRILRTFPEDAARRLAAQWLAIFGKNRSGVNAGAFLWHIFSGARYPSVQGEVAIEEYRRQVGGEFIVLSNDCKQAVATDLLPSCASLSDYYVFPPDFAWTMAFTHEAGWLGPYFARHPDYTALHRKAQEAAVAREKGWHAHDE